jgi:TPR repeat protein
MSSRRAVLTRPTVTMQLQWGERIEQDFKKAVYYYEKAAAHREKPASMAKVGACFHLGEMYLEGRGVEQNLQRALAYFEVASSVCPKADLYIAWLLWTSPGCIEQDRKKARDIVVQLLKMANYPEELTRKHKTAGHSWSRVVAWYNDQSRAVDIVVPRWS